jgi:hypothetical protein
VVGDAADARLSGAIGTAEKRFFRLDAVTDNFAATLSANGREFMDGALETIERVAISRRNDFKR